MTKLSIIIPVYNEEKYINECLLSLLNQDISKTDYEIIVINNGSTDSSKRIILDIKKLHDNLIYIEQKNKGVSSARNRGLAVAKGKYITFVDADDLIYKNTLSLIVKKAETNNLDLLYLAMETINANGEYISTIEANGDDNIIKKGIDHPRRTFAATLYKKNLIQDHRFDENISFGEDTVFNTLIHINSKRCSYYSLPYYKYRKHENSQTSSKDLEKLFTGFKHAITIINEYKLKNYPQATNQEQKYFDNVSSIFLERILYLTLMTSLHKKRFNSIKQKLYNYNLGYLIERKSKKYKFFNKPFYVFYMYHRLKKTYNSILGFGSKIKRKIIHA